MRRAQNSAGRRKAARPVGLGTKHERCRDLEALVFCSESDWPSRPALQAGPAESPSARPSVCSVSLWFNPWTRSQRVRKGLPGSRRTTLDAVLERGVEVFAAPEIAQQVRDREAAGFVEQPARGAGAGGVRALRVGAAQPAETGHERRERHGGAGSACGVGARHWSFQAPSPAPRSTTPARRAWPACGPARA